MRNYYLPSRYFFCGTCGTYYINIYYDDVCMSCVYQVSIAGTRLASTRLVLGTFISGVDIVDLLVFLGA